MIPHSGTFDYVGIMPAGDGPPWTVPMKTAVDRRDVRHPSLAGASPWLTIAEAGLTPDAGWARGVWRPCVQRARFSLTSDSPKPRRETAGAFHLDSALTRAFNPSDAIHLSRTGCGGIGVSVLRSGRLVFALGAITAVPLGEDVVARIPSDLIADVEAVFQRRDPSFELGEYPVEITVGGGAPFELASFADHGSLSRPELPSAYEIVVYQGFRRGIPGIDESAAIFHRDLCSASGVHASAQLLGADGLEV